jgi:general stress protein 26
MDTQADRHAHLHEILEDFGSAMLVTRAAGGGVHARPMRIAELRPDGDLLFVTSLDSPKVAEIEADADVCVTFQSKAQYAAVYGVARLERDRALIDRLWSPEWKAWFPKGKDDPSICLIRVDGRQGEFWDNAGAQAIQYAWEATKSLVQGKKPDVSDKVHAKVKL